jgi:hypothetical protein
MAKDYFGQELIEGDSVAFPAQGDMMSGVIEKIKVFTRRTNGEIIRVECYVLNKSGYKKWKVDNTLIKKPKEI